MNQINMRRLISDIKQIKKNPIDNIYYIHDETNMTKGYALIIGGEDTPYAYGYYLFEFNFPNTYPFDPPIVIYHTNDGYTRFNPNLYINGKVCLSMLNTWKGEGWTSCQTISTILLTLTTVLNNIPITNEPGLTIQHRDHKQYNDMLNYKNIEIAILGILNKRFLNNNFENFYDIIVEKFLENKDKILKNLNNLKNEIEDNSIIRFGLYNSKYLVNFNNLENKFNEISLRLK
tara:strand:+ start:1247 stop:1942 length:696 start_codon:yes stop_codon:yes gene_type:complete